MSQRPFKILGIQQIAIDHRRFRACRRSYMNRRASSRMPLLPGGPFAAKLAASLLQGARAGRGRIGKAVKFRRAPSAV